MTGPQPAGGAVIHGQVVDAGGRPVGNARVMVLTGPGSYPDIALLTDDDGRFVLGLRGAGEYELGVQADGFRPATVAVRPPETPTEPVRVRLVGG